MVGSLPNCCPRVANSPAAARPLSVMNFKSIHGITSQQARSAKSRWARSAPPTERLSQTGWDKASAALREFHLGYEAHQHGCPMQGFIIPISKTTQGYLNIKGYKEFDNANRPDGCNAWVTFVLSPAEQTPSASSRRVRSM